MDRGCQARVAISIRIASFLMCMVPLLASGEESSPPPSVAPESAQSKFALMRL